MITRVQYRGSWRLKVGEVQKVLPSCYSGDNGEISGFEQTFLSKLRLILLLWGLLTLQGVLKHSCFVCRTRGLQGTRRKVFFTGVAWQP